MSYYSEFYSAVDDIAEHLRMDFIGPIESDEVLEEEAPLNRYSLGILWGQRKSAESESTDMYSSMEEMFEDESEDNEKPKDVSIFKPSTMGISFAVLSGDRLNIDFTYAVYNYVEEIITDNGKEVKRHYYKREVKEFQTSVVAPDKLCRKVVCDRENSDIGVYLHVRKVNDDNSELVTVSVVNKHRASTNFS